MALSERREGLLTAGIVTTSTQSKRTTQRLANFRFTPMLVLRRRWGDVIPQVMD
jgi:hypothetical protein